MTANYPLFSARHDSHRFHRSFDQWKARSKFYLQVIKRKGHARAHLRTHSMLHFDRSSGFQEHIARFARCVILNHRTSFRDIIFSHKSIKKAISVSGDRLLGWWYRLSALWQAWLTGKRYKVWFPADYLSRWTMRIGWHFTSDTLHSD